MSTDLFHTPPADAAAALQVAQRRQVAMIARSLERKLGALRRARLKVRKLEEDARAIKREMELWMRAEVPAATHIVSTAERPIDIYGEEIEP